MAENCRLAQPTHYLYPVGQALEALAMQLRANLKSPRRAAKVGLAILKVAVKEDVLDRFNEVSDVANGECKGELSERTLDACFEDDDVRRHLIPLLLDTMDTQSSFKTGMIRDFGQDTINRWRREFRGGLFTTENFQAEQAEQARATVLQVKGLIAELNPQRTLALEF